MADAQNPGSQPADPDLAPLGVKLGIGQPWRWCLNRHPVLILLVFSALFPGLTWLSRILNMRPWVYDPSWLTLLEDFRFPFSIFIMAIMLRDGNDVPASYFPVFKVWLQRAMLAVLVLGLAGLLVFGILQADRATFMLGFVAFAGWAFTVYAMPFQLFALWRMFRRHRAWEAPEMVAGAVAVAFLLFGVPVLPSFF